MSSERLPDTQQLLHELRRVVGDDAVLTGDALAGHADPYSFLEDDEIPAPLAAVQPTSVEQVQQVVALAARTGVPLWTVSRGRNFAYGGAAPRLPGSIVLDLQRMDRVLEVDEELGYVVIEPGVSFLDLHAHLSALGASLLMSVPDIGWGSVMGNALERGKGYAQHGEHSAAICGLEVVMADGTVVHTGMGALPGSTAGPLYQGGYGPSLEGLFLQSNLGIVTRMGLWLAPRPETVIVCSIQAASDDALGPLIDALRPLQLDGTIQSPVTIGSAGILAVVLTERAQWHTGPGAMPHEQTAEIVQRLGVGWWNARFGLYGPASLTAARLDVVRAALADLPDLELVAHTYAGDVTPDQVFPPDLSQLGVPTLSNVRMAAWRGGTPAHTDVSLVGPSRSADVLRQRDLLRTGITRYGFDYAGGFTMYGRYTIALALVSFDRDDAEERAAVRALFPELLAEAAAHGYGTYRSHTAFMDLIAAHFGADDGALRHVVEKIKDALDPKGILSPGKQGIWPGRSTA
ncbi:MAG TPA: FAD-binding oxidoreductase [Mycobacteriales bacterium]|nr:FAD-binding oxidoreductase [Mycobacteriales bacterium]